MGTGHDGKDDHTQTRALRRTGRRRPLSSRTLARCSWRDAALNFEVEKRANASVDFPLILHTPWDFPYLEIYRHLKIGTR